MSEKATKKDIESIQRLHEAGYPESILRWYIGFDEWKAQQDK